MTASTLTHLPVAAGAATLTGATRAGGWALTRFMRQPLANTGMAAMAALIALASINALYSQTMQHPAPLFAASPSVPTPVSVPANSEPQVILPVESAPQAQPANSLQGDPAARETTGSVGSDGPTGNPDVYAVQKKLSELGHYDGTLDGLYGPNTARAIRAFEERRGLEPEGAMSEDVVEAILGASADDAPAARTNTADAAPVPVTPREQPTELERAQLGGAPSRPESGSANQTIDSIVAALANGDGAAPARREPAPVEKPMQVADISQTQVSAQPMPEPVATDAAPAEEVAELPPIETRRTTPPASDTELVTQIQRGLASLGFLHGKIDGVPGDTTARAIRNFEVYYNYRVTGQIRPELVKLLTAAGASV